MLPLIPFMLISTLIGSVISLGWYNALSPAEQEQANRLTVAYARRLYNKCVEDLTHSEMRYIHDLVKRHIIRVDDIT